MMKFFETIGALIVTACLIQIASDPSSVMRDIRRGPVPSLVTLDAHLKGRGSFPPADKSNLARGAKPCDKGRFWGSK